jgi:hypothetical protein
MRACMDKKAKVGGERDEIEKGSTVDQEQAKKL